MSDIEKPSARPNPPAWLWAVLTVLLPILVTASVQLTGIFQKDRELDIKVLELAVGVLKVDPESGQTSDGATRKWAIGVVGKITGVQFSEEAKKELIAKPLVVEDPPATVTPTVTEEERGWVAVGFLESPTDRNFTLSNGKPITTLAEGMIVKAVRAINVRPRAASWGRVSTVLETGQCFRIAKTRELDAAGRAQTWASGDLSDCE